MPTTYTGTDTYDTSYSIPDDADPETAASVNDALEKLGNRTTKLKADLDAIDGSRLGVRTLRQVDFGAYTTLGNTTPLPQMTVVMLGIGLYAYDPAAPNTSDIPYRVRSNVAGGAWLLEQYVSGAQISSNVKTHTESSDDAAAWSAWFTTTSSSWTAVTDGSFAPVSTPGVVRIGDTLEVESVIQVVLGAASPVATMRIAYVYDSAPGTVIALPGAKAAIYGTTAQTVTLKGEVTAASVDTMSFATHVIITGGGNTLYALGSAIFRVRQVR